MGNPIYAKKLEVGEPFIFGIEYGEGKTATYINRKVIRYELTSADDDVYFFCILSKYSSSSSLLVHSYGFVSLGKFSYKESTLYNGCQKTYSQTFDECFNEYSVKEPSSTTSYSPVVNGSGYAFRYQNTSYNSYIFNIENAYASDFVDSIGYQCLGNNSEAKTLFDYIYSKNMQIGETDNWLCNGTEVAPFPETLTFKVLAEVDGQIALIASASPAEYVLHDSSGDTLVFNGAVACEAYIYDVENVAWVSEGNASLESLPCGNITWANYILNRKPSADSTETEEIPRDTMIGGTTYDGADYFETPDTGGSGGDNEGGNTDEPDNPIIDKGLDMNSFMLGYKAGKKLRRFRILGF